VGLGIGEGIIGRKVGFLRAFSGRYLLKRDLVFWCDIWALFFLLADGNIMDGFFLVGSLIVNIGLFLFFISYSWGIFRVFDVLFNSFEEGLFSLCLDSFKFNYAQE
jgi:hypothetical protein